MSIGLPGRLFTLTPRFIGAGNDLWAAMCWSDGVKKTYEIPSSKHQISNKSQIPILNDQNTKQVWNFEFWSLLFV
jgi:hypothetical protein